MRKGVREAKRYKNLRFLYAFYALQNPLGFETVREECKRMDSP
jgi:hypothetical protein